MLRSYNGLDYGSNSVEGKSDQILDLFPTQNFLLD